MIYTRNRLTVIITADYGLRKPDYLNYPARLVQCQLPDGQLFYRWAETLSADDGLREILLACEAAPKAKLTAYQLRKAFKEAE